MKKSSKEKIKGVAQMGVTLGHIGAMLLSPKGVKDKYDITDSYQKAKEFFNNSNKCKSKEAKAESMTDSEIEYAMMFGKDFEELYKSRVFYNRCVSQCKPYTDNAEKAAKLLVKLHLIYFQDKKKSLLDSSDKWNAHKYIIPKLEEMGIPKDNMPSKAILDINNYEIYKKIIK